MERSDASVRQLQAELSHKNDQLEKLQSLLTQIEKKQLDEAAKAKANEEEVRARAPSMPHDDNALCYNSKPHTSPIPPTSPTLISQIASLRAKLEESDQLNASLTAQGTRAVAEARAQEDRINGLGAQIHADSIRMAEMEMEMKAQVRRADEAESEAVMATEQATLMAAAAAAKKPATQRGRSPAQRGRSPAERGREPVGRRRSPAGGAVSGRRRDRT